MASSKTPGPGEQPAPRSAEMPPEANRKDVRMGGTSAPRSRTIEGENFLEGKLLIALPGMSDPRFEKSVIYMCAHSGEGAMGIIINKPVEGLHFPDLMKKLELATTPRTPNMPILYGGPVE